MKHLLLTGLLLSPLAGSAGESVGVKCEPLSLTVSKLSRDTFGNGMNPFQMDFHAVSGTQLMLKITLPQADSGTPLAESTKLTKFVDDAGTDLIDDRQQPMNAMWEANRPLTILPSRTPGMFGLVVRSPKTPASGATQLQIDGTLSFAPKQGRKEVKAAGFMLENALETQVGPVKLKFTQKEAGNRGFPQPQDQAPAQKEQAVGWWLQYVADPSAVATTVTLYGEDDQHPLIRTDDSRDQYSSSSSQRIGNQSSFRSVTMHGFRCPGGKISRVVVQFALREHVVKVPFHCATGIGMEKTGPTASE